MRRLLLEILIELTVGQVLWARFIINQGYSEYDPTMLSNYQTNYHPHPNGYTNQYGYEPGYGYNPYYTPFHHMFQFSRSMPFMYNSPGSYYDEWRKVHRPLPGGGSCIFVDYYKQCSEGFIGLKSHPTHQQYYYICKPDQIILSKCLHSQIFNNTTRHCIQQQQQQNSDYIPTCTSYGIFPILSNCNLYYRCDHNLRSRLYNCTNDMVFSLTQRRCVSDDKCIPKQIISNATYIPESLEEKFPQCLKVGLFRSPTDCSLYFKCEIQSNGIYLQTRFKCPEEMLYDVSRNQCVSQQDNHYDCYHIDGESINSNIKEPEDSDNSSSSSEEIEGSSNDELLITADETTELDENNLITPMPPELIAFRTNSDFSDTAVTEERLLSTLVPPFEETTSAVLSDDDDDKLDASGNTYRSKMAMKVSAAVALEDFDTSTDFLSDSDNENNEIEEQTTTVLSYSKESDLAEENLIPVTETAANTEKANNPLESYTKELSNSKESLLLEENLIAVAETEANKKNTKKVPSNSTSIIEANNTEPCTKPITDPFAKETPSQVPHLEIIAKRPLDIHLSVCPNNCNRTHEPQKDLKDNQMVLLRWYNNATNKTFILDQQQN